MAVRWTEWSETGPQLVMLHKVYGLVGCLGAGSGDDGDGGNRGRLCDEDWEREEEGIEDGLRSGEKLRISLTCCRLGASGGSLKTSREMEGGTWSTVGWTW